MRNSPYYMQKCFCSVKNNVRNAKALYNNFSSLFRILSAFCSRNKRKLYKVALLSLLQYIQSINEIKEFRFICSSKMTDEKKSIISTALSESVAEVKNEEKSAFFVTKKDAAYIVNNLPMLMKTLEKKCRTFLTLVKTKNANKSVTANQIAKVMTALLNDEKVLDVVKQL